jgi:hypothetical protein
MLRKLDSLKQQLHQLKVGGRVDSFKQQLHQLKVGGRGTASSSSCTSLRLEAEEKAAMLRKLDSLKQQLHHLK